MSARRFIPLLSITVAAVAFAMLPATALAGDDSSSDDSSSVSAADSVSIATSVDSAADSSDAAEASDSPASDIYTIDQPKTEVVDACTETAAVEPAGTVCGGGGPETPTVVEAEPVVVDGGGSNPIAAPEAVGGGGPELPFTGLPLITGIYFGIGLILAGGGLWARSFVLARR